MAIVIVKKKKVGRLAYLMQAVLAGSRYRRKHSYPIADLVECRVE
jgi:hypothetical protein